MLFKEIISVYTENRMKLLNTKCRVSFKGLNTACAEGQEGKLIKHCVGN
jgi:hypothetical protein